MTPDALLQLVDARLDAQRQAIIDEYADTIREMRADDLAQKDQIADLVDSHAELVASVQSLQRRLSEAERRLDEAARALSWNNVRCR